MSLLRPIANNHTSKSLPYSQGLKIALFLSDHCATDKPSYERTAGCSDITLTTICRNCPLIILQPLLLPSTKPAW